MSGPFPGLSHSLEGTKNDPEAPSRSAGEAL